MCLAIGTCSAADTPSRDLHETLLLGRTADHFLDRSGKLDIEAVAHEAEGVRFTPGNGRVPSYGVRPTPNAAMWMRTHIPKLDLSASHWTLNLNASRVRNAQLYIPNQGGWTSLNWSYEANPAGATGRLRYPAFDVRADEISNRVVYLRFEVAGSMRGLLWLSPRSQFLTDYADESLWFGILFGITLALFAYSLAMGLALRELSLIAVAALALTFFIYVFADRGFFETSAIPGATSWSRLLSYPGTFAIYASWLFFELLYLRAAEHMPRLAKLYRYVGVSCVLMAVWAVGEIAFDSFRLRKFVGLIGLTLIALQFLLAAALLRKEKWRAAAFLIAWAPGLIGGSGRLFVDVFPALGASPFLINGTYTGPLLSIFLFAIMMSLDIQLRERKLRAAVETSQQRFRSFADSASDSFWETDRDGLLTFRSGPASLAARLDPGQRMMNALRVAASPADQPVLKNLERTFEAQQPFRGVAIQMGGEGGTRHLAFSGSPVFDRDGGFSGYRGIAADLTADVVRLERDAQQQKMAAIGHLAGGIAHEINNLLHPIINLSRRVAAQFASPDERRGYLEIVAEAGVRASEIVAGILASVRPSLAQTQAVAFSAAVEQAIAGIQPILPAAIVLQSRIEAEGGRSVSPGEVFQVISNLTGNAIYATGAAGCIGITLTAGFFPTGQPCVVLAVSDDGEGMDAEIRQRVFEPFFTTKQPGKGTGLGLSIVYGIVRGWGGTIDVESERGKGTTIVIRVPRTADSGVG